MTQSASVAQAGQAPPSVAGLTFVGWQQPIACGGVAVFPHDIVVVDDDVDVREWGRTITMDAGVTERMDALFQALEL